MKVNKRKIVIASGTYLPEVSGQSTFVSNLKKNLPTGYESVIVAYGPQTITNHNVYIIKRNIFRYFNYYLAIRRQARDASIIYIQDLVSSGLPASLAKRKSNKLIVRIGGDFLWEKMVNSGKCDVPFMEYYNRSKTLVENIYILIYKLVLSRCSNIIFNTKWQADKYQDIFDLSKDKISVIDNPLTIDHKNSTTSNNEIIFAGRFIAVKNIIKLIEAFRQIKTNKQLTLIGIGPQKEILQQLIKNDSRIKIEDQLSHDDMLKRLANCYMFVLPSLSEMNPNAALEALGLGKPVVLTKEVGLTEDKKAYFKLVDPISVDSIKNGIEYFLDIDNYNKHLEKVKNLENNCTVKDLIEKHLQLFNQINIVNIGIDKSLIGGKQLGDAVVRHKKYGHYINQLDIVVYSNKNENFKKYIISDNVIGYPTNSLSKIFFCFDVRKIFKQINKKHHIDIIQAQDPFLPALSGLVMKIKYGAKLQINFHGDFWQNKNWLKERMINFIFLLISKITVPMADAIRVMSEGQKEKLISAGIDKNKIRVISTPVDLNKYLNCQPYAQLTKNVLHIGRNDDVKDYHTLVRAFKIVKEKINDAVFLQVGAKSKVEEAMIKNNFQDIEILGSKSADELVDIYNNSNIIVLSSTSESFGKVLVEANAASRPIVSTNTTGAREIIRDNYNGFLVTIGNPEKLADKIIYLLEHPQEAKIIGDNGRKLVVEKYGDNTDKIVNFWQETINKK